ncbi:MAG: hypothetical protein SOX71_03585 [Candidatus Faecousia sp.]|nr:hypothetical protein [Candidatus Faecousia sp.]
MEENAFTLKCDAHAIKVNYDSLDKISLIKVYPQANSEIKITLGKHRITVNGDALQKQHRQKQK